MPRPRLPSPRAASDPRIPREMRPGVSRKWLRRVEPRASSAGTAPQVKACPMGIRATGVAISNRSLQPRGSPSAPRPSLASALMAWSVRLTSPSTAEKTATGDRLVPDNTTSTGRAAVALANHRTKRRDISPPSFRGLPKTKRDDQTTRKPEPITHGMAHISWPCSPLSTTPLMAAVAVIANNTRETARDARPTRARMTRSA